MNREIVALNILWSGPPRGRTLGWRVLTAFWVTFKFCHADSILLVHLHQKRDVPSLITLGAKLLVPRPMQFYKEIP